MISIPHGGSRIPQAIKSQYAGDLSRFRFHEDFGTIELGLLKEYPCIVAQESRFVVDLNRARDDLARDLGVIMRTDFHGKSVLARDLSPEEIEERLEKYYDPYYERLSRIVRPGTFVLDVHSMDGEGNLGAAGPRPDIDVASAHGRTASEGVRSVFVEEFAAEGLDVRENDPYPGANARIINFCSELGAQAIELEFNKRLYMDEATLELDRAAIARLQAALRRILARIAAI